MSTNVALTSAEGGDPRMAENIITDNQGHDSQAFRQLHDASITFEEYRYYAEKTREEERVNSAEDAPVGFWQVIFPSKSDSGVKPIQEGARVSDSGSGNEEKKTELGADTTGAPPQSHRLLITDAEWTNAARATRTASGAACFYLITTDILGPFGVGYTLGTLGWGPGIALFTAFGLMAGYSGYLLWTCFMGLDSYEYPCKNYADLGLRIYGRPFRYLINFLQSVQLLLSVGIIVIGNGQALSQVSKFRLCYAICCLIWAICGFGLGQVRTLQKFGILANAAVFLNLMVIFISMGVIGNSPPNYEIGVIGSAGSLVDLASITPYANGTYPAVIHYAGLPDPSSLIGSLTGLMQAVYAYAGAQLFVEFMSEMKRPNDFLKAMWGAQFFIYVVYMSYGCFVYYFQGQYSFQNAYQGVSPYAWQVVGDMLAIIGGLIAASLYGNIGIKVLYNNIFIEFFRAPSLQTKPGKILWICLVPVYWAIAFIVAASIPAFFGLTAVTAAVCFVQFVYSFPPILGLGYYVQLHAQRDDEGFDPVTGQVTKHDRGLKRLIRGFLAKRWYVNIWLIIYAGGALALSGLGAYASITSLIDTFKNPQVNAFSCTSPLDLSPS